MTAFVGATLGRGKLSEACYDLAMLRFFDLFGKSAALNALDAALRSAGVHPALVPEAVKLTLMRIVNHEDADRGQARLEDGAALLAYCMLGRDQFVNVNGLDAADHVQTRVDAAIDAGTSADAKLILLALHAGLITREIAEQFDAEED
jgi:hypothetical protein